MDDDQVLAHIDRLAKEERALHERGGASPTGLSSDDHARLEQVEVEMDRAWDYLRQRRALRRAGRDPNEAKPRDADTVESYLQ